MRVLGSNRDVFRETGTFSDHNDIDENIEFRNVFPNSGFIDIEYFNESENKRSFA